MYQPSITSCLSVSCQRDIIPIQPRRVQPAMGCEAFLLIGAWQVAASDSESARASVPWQLIPTAAVIPVHQRALPTPLSDVDALGWVSVAFLAALPCSGFR